MLVRMWGDAYIHGRDRKLKSTSDHYLHVCTWAAKAAAAGAKAVPVAAAAVAVVAAMDLVVGLEVMTKANIAASDTQPA